MIFYQTAEYAKTGNCEAPALEKLLSTDGAIEFFRLVDSVIKY